MPALFLFPHFSEKRLLAKNRDAERRQTSETLCNFARQAVKNAAAACSHKDDAAARKPLSELL